MKYESELIKEIVDTRGHEKSSLHYQSECIETWIEETKGAYPKLTDYQSEWLNYIVENPIGDFPYVTLSDVTEATIENVVPYAYKSAILKGQTLVNYAQITEHDFKDGRVIVQDLLKPLEIGKPYTIIMNIVSQTVTTGITVRFAKDKNNYTGIKTFNGLGLHKYLYNATDSFNQFSPYVNNEEYQTGLSAKYNQLMILDGDYTNVDIPYFEGMQSVKMPVLMTTGKNLFPKGISEFSETSLESTTVNEDVVTIKFNDTNGRIAYRLNKKDFDVTRDIYIFADVNLSEVYTQNTSVYAMFCRQQGMGSVYNSIKIATTGWQRLRLHIPSNVIKDDFDILFYKSASIVGHTPTLQVKNISIQYIDNGSYEPYQSNILSASEDVTLRKIGDVQDTLDCLTGEVTQRVGEVVLDGSEYWVYTGDHVSNEEYAVYHTKITTPINSLNIGIADKLDYDKEAVSPTVFTKECVYINSAYQMCYVRIKRQHGGIVNYLSSNPITLQYQLATESIKTVDLIIQDQNGNDLSKIKPIEGTMNLSTSGTPINPSFSGEIPVEATTQNLASFIEE